MESMELNISKCSYDGKWFDFGNGRLKIRPYPASKQNFAVKDGNIVFTGAETFDRFKYCLVEWDRYVTPAPENKPIELTDEVKKKVFDFRLGSVMNGDQETVIADFVANKANEMFAEMRAAENQRAAETKNLSSGSSSES